MNLCPTKDLDLYPVIKVGHFVRFESNGGTPIEYQFVLATEKAIEPKAPERTGYTFDKWYSDEACTAAYDFNTVVTADIKLYAKWIPTTSPYKVNIWLENPNRGSGTATASDYIFYGYYTKSAATEAKNITYTVADFTTGTMEKSVAFVRKGDIASQIFFLDDQYGSQALTLTNASLAAVNEEGVKADGSTELNVYLRRAEYNFTLKDSSSVTS